MVTLAEVEGHPIGIEGEVTGVHADRNLPPYEVTLDNGSMQITATAEDLERIDLHMFKVGTRVRLTQDFAGFLWDQNIAWEKDNPEQHCDPVSYPAGTTGTIAFDHPTIAENYLIEIDDDPNALAVGSSTLERIRGRTRVIEEPDGNTQICQLFDFHDAVRLRKDVTFEDGSTRNAGSGGMIDALDLHRPAAEVMRECWRTGKYGVTFFDGAEQYHAELPWRLLQLDSDLYRRAL
ncbi:hypothetical protein [Kribbella antiqua]|uniref:hypothetical protein n=1 Tax=Kribbella antiqua TaxID=2512217 RepID=UPI00104EAE77|nr:hypothetical protein [Kribbella antiqua]